jgi:RNA polymerase sigma-70 factor, ECF subfamily
MPTRSPFTPAPPIRRPPIVADDRASFRRGLIALLPDLRSRALRFARDGATADDLVQDAVERALRFADQYVCGTSLRAWTQQILFSVFVTRYRRSRRDRNALRKLGEDPCAWTQPEPLARPDGEIALTRATRARLDALPIGFRAVIELVDLGEASYRDAAIELGVPVGTVMSRLHRGRRLLAQGLGDREAA